MLILMRRCDESIMIGDDIRIKVLKIQGNQVHLGIDAPREIAVHRQEIWDQIKEENRNAGRTPAELHEVDLSSFKALWRRE